MSSIQDSKHLCQSFIKAKKKEQVASLWKASIMKSIIVLAFLGLASTYPQERPNGKQIVWSLGWSKTPVSSQTDELMAGTKFSDYLGKKHYKKAKKLKHFIHLRSTNWP